jgi:hypothetical protein
MDVPAYTSRCSRRKKAVARWISNYLYEAADVGQWYTEAQWKTEIFDAGAAGIRSALSAKVKSGKLEGQGVYAPPGVDPTQLTLQEKVNIVCTYSIFNVPKSNWTLDTLQEFEKAEVELEQEAALKTARPKLLSAYDAEKKTIPFLGEDRVVSGALINDFIRLLPPLWTSKALEICDDPCENSSHFGE